MARTTAESGRRSAAAARPRRRVSGRADSKKPAEGDRDSRVVAGSGGAEECTEPGCESSAERVASVVAGLPSAEALSRMSVHVSALADTTRLKIVCALLEDELCVHEMAEVAGMKSNAIAHHLKLLKLSGVVQTRREGLRVYYRLVDDCVREIVHLVREHIEGKHGGE